MTIMEALEKAKRFKEQRHDPARSDQLRHVQAPSDTGVLRVLDDNAVQPEATPLQVLARVTIDPGACERNRILFTDEQIANVPGGAAAYRMLRSWVGQRVRANNWSCIGMSSPGPGEGKTVTALNLAMTAAREKQRTLYLLDLDMRNPRVLDYLGLQPPTSLAQYFREEVGAAEVLFETDLEGLIVAGATEPVRNASELLATSRLEELLLVIRQRSPGAVILIDLPPVTATDEALVVAPRLDALLLVATEGRTNRDSLARSAELLGDFPVAGLILNCASESVGTDYYGY